MSILGSCALLFAPIGTVFCLVYFMSTICKKIFSAPVFIFSTLLLMSSLVFANLFSQHESTSHEHSGPTQLISHEHSGPIVSPFDQNKKIQTVNFISGTPLTGGGDNTGGFGDVAANLLNAFNLKKSNPELAINFIVTSAAEREAAEVLTTNEIIKIMYPNLNPELKNIPQKFEGIDFIFLDHDFKKMQFMNQNTDADISKLKSVIPKADLSLQFSANDSAMEPVLRTNTNMALSFYEPTGKRKSVQQNHSHGDFAQHYMVYSGGQSSGYYLFDRPSDYQSIAQDKTLISQWAQDSGFGSMSGKEELLFAYSKNSLTMKAYLEALKIHFKDPKFATGKPYVLFAKKFAAVDYSGFPEFVRVVNVESLPHNVMEALIANSSISPLVTGDVSLSIALSTIKPNKTFVYEAPYWKSSSADSMVSAIRSNLTSEQNKQFSEHIDASFIQDTHLYYGTEKSTEKLVNLFNSPEANKLIYSKLNLLRSRWSILKNTSLIHSFLKAFSGKHAIPEIILAEVSLNLMKAGNWKRLVHLSEAQLKNPNSKPETAISASFILAHYGKNISTETQQIILNWLVNKNPEVWPTTELLLSKSAKNLRNLIDLAKTHPVGSALNSWGQKAEVKLNYLNQFREQRAVESPRAMSAGSCKMLFGI